jgi:hypothetical protein
MQRADRTSTAAKRYFEKSMDQNGVPETITIDESSANHAAPESTNTGLKTLGRFNAPILSSVRRIGELGHNGPAQLPDDMTFQEAADFLVGGLYRSG